MLTVENQRNAVAESALLDQRYVVPGSALATQEIDTDKQMSQLFEEVNQMKAFMEQIKKGEVIGEFAQNSASKKDLNQSEMILKDSIKAQNIEDLKR